MIILWNCWRKINIHTAVNWKVYRKNWKNLWWRFDPEDLEGYYFSAPVKRMIWQTVLILREIEKVMGQPPKRLFVEMTREDGEKNVMKDSRTKKFIELYKNIKAEDQDWKKVIENAEQSGTIRSKKMYLYLTQRGRCMYTGKPIDLSQLFDNNLYDIDHIYPRHYVKDDNLENNMVLVEKQKMPIRVIIIHWKNLFITNSFLSGKNFIIRN